MITLQELCEYLDQLLQPFPITDYCVNGLQVEGRKEIEKIATGVTANLATLQRASELNADALLVHHGIFWNQDNHQIKGIKKEKLSLLLKNEISLIAYHLPLDMHTSLGNNWKAAIEMGWTDLEPFCNIKGHYLGVKGRLKKISREDFQKKLEDYYQHPAQSALGGKKEIETAALVSGGGYRFINQAIADRMDCFVTGNFDEPVWHQAFEENMNFYALGHSATERIGPRSLGNHLSEKFGLEHQFIDVYNPF